MKRFAVVLMVLGIVCAPVTAHASAAPPPTHEPQPSVEFNTPAGTLCPFPVHVVQDNSGTTITTFYNAQGDVQRMILSGTGVLTFTNRSTGETATFAIHGVERRFDFSNDQTSFTSVSSGTFVLFDPFGTHVIVTGEAIATYTLVPSAGAYRVTTKVLRGTTVDICGAIS